MFELKKALISQLSPYLGGNQLTHDFNFKLNLLGFWISFQQVFTVDLHPSSKSTSALASTSKGSGATTATLTVVIYTLNEKASAGREVTAIQVTESAARIRSDRVYLPYLPFVLQKLM